MSAPQPLPDADLLTPDEPATEVAPPSRRRGVPAFLRRPGGALGAAWLVVVVLASLTAPLWVPYDVTAQDLGDRLSLPSADHLLGTDPLGRDLLSRIATAGSLPLLSSALMLVVAFGIGLPLALVAAERPGRTERLISRATEVLLALPATVLLLAVIGIVGNDIPLVMAVFGVLLSAAVYRVMLGVAQSVRQRLYVDAARVDGLGSVRVNVRHVLPAMGTVIAVQAAQLFGIGILVVAGLAFLGFGPGEPDPSWGFMINDASSHLFDGPWLLVPSGLVLALTVVAANELADALAARGGAGARRRSRRARTTTPAPAPSAVPAADPAPVPDDAVLAVRDLRVSVVDGPDLVTGVSLTVRRGTVLGLVGESGCGKSMTARSLLGLLPDGVEVSGGSISFQGTDLVGLAEGELRGYRGSRIALISQEPMVALDPAFSVATQLTGPIRRHRGVGRREARTIAAQLLRNVGIVDADRILGSYPHQLSGGMAQRVCIALALTGEPDLLVADEPTTALDVTVQAEILSLLRALVRDTGLSVVLVTHDLGVVADLCDDVAVMYAGEVVEAGATTAVLDEPRHPYTMALLGADPHVPDGEPVPERLASIAGTVPSPGTWPVGCRFAGRCLFATDECRTPFPAVPAHGGGLVRCVRVEDLALHRISWTPEEAGAEIAAVDVVPTEITAGGAR
ncbi:dipeptide/oligopeptide/nickel ABC transporter permease/ATP-binding protein [Klenkia terrae]|uniref:dipeptide/oligopeptide/nickel ABC transporter permease/ATP-binding protein n=1 Tax=Klenkia terrae TaxID=1052259 RepID=UPI001CD85A8F|nr:dipeptide/oligopeptide/nickel ABC transporter permease/ATP-binding protein [Klenkia terrae]